VDAGASVGVGKKAFVTDGDGDGGSVAVWTGIEVAVGVPALFGSTDGVVVMLHALSNMIEIRSDIIRQLLNIVFIVNNLHILVPNGWELSCAPMMTQC
jgi:hypothetical protein